MKAVLMSIKPKWCELIASGEKTVEVRKTAPKLKPPFKDYIYCTIGDGARGDRLVPSGITCGKVIGEFVCDNIIDYTIDPYGYHSYFINDDDFEQTCFTLEENFWEYGRGATLYGWHISDLVIYEKPKELSEFSKYGFERFVPVKRPPQSWCYVEEQE